MSHDRKKLADMLETIVMILRADIPEEMGLVIDYEKLIEEIRKQVQVAREL